LPKPAIFALADSSVFEGYSIGIDGQSTGEVVFNTAMTGYQEILTDPSYSGQIITLTYPHIGNTGTNTEDEEASSIFAKGLIVRDIVPCTSSWRNQLDLPDYLQKNKVIGIAGIDTRRLTRILRTKGAQGGCIMAGENASKDQAIEYAKSFAGLQGADLAKEVSTQSVYEWNTGTWDLETGLPEPSTNLKYHVVAYDFGIKRNILRMLVDRGCHITVVPAQTSADVVLGLQADGVFLSNGPGDPEPCDYAVRAIKAIVDSGMPVFGICLGHQLLALASGAKTRKMKFGHHGANHPVQDLNTQQVLITSQNHGFAVDEETLPDNLVPTHRSLFDSSLQGIEHTDKPVFSFQGHPEASPGPHDVGGLFDKFLNYIESSKKT